MIFFLLLFGCSDGDQNDEYGAPLQDLVMPDLEGIDLDAAFAEGLQKSLAITLNRPWQAHVAALELRHDGCPDLYVGVPDIEDADDFDPAAGMYWSDRCTTAGGLYYGGYTYWESDFSLSGDPKTDSGQTLSGSRSITASGIVSVNDNVQFEFKGTGSDSLYLVQAKGYTQWSYTSLVEASIGDGEELNGVRTDLYLYASGGDDEDLELRGNAYMPEFLIMEHFDSIGSDMVLQGPVGAGAETCTLEPTGWFALRDQNAYWYDLVFLPMEGDVGADDPECDGCGTLYVRGVNDEALATVCMDFSSVWTEDTITLPEATDFLYTLRQLEEP